MNIQEFARRAMKAPLLEKEEEYALIRAWQKDRDQAAIDRLVYCYGRLVLSIIPKFKYYGIPTIDLLQEGILGILNAATRFEVDKNVRFSTYASWWIRSYIQDYILRNWSIVRTGTTASQKSLFFNYRRIRSRLDNTSFGELSEDQFRSKIAEELNLPVKDVLAMEGRFLGDRSLNALVDEAGETEHIVMHADVRQNPEEDVISNSGNEQFQSWLEEALSTLNSREYYIILHRRLIDKVLTLEAVGEDLNISKERVRQLEVRALSKMRQVFEKYIDDPEDVGIFKQ